MATIQLPRDFREFFQLLNANQVEYLLVGGYAVIYYGYPRSTGDLDVWVATNADNARKLLATLDQFGFGHAGATAEVLSEPNRVIRMGVPPLRIEIQTSISGATFADCYARRLIADLGGIPVPVISVEDLKRNKRAAGRHKDLTDLENLG
ncbi:MAG: hypothetical protein KA354_19535 [Phycisphaerae bacterium]|nr:hypothetical protein [Phycisphaerae bacterium]